MKTTMKLASRAKRFAAGCIDMAFPVVAYLMMRSITGFSAGMDPYSYNPESVQSLGDGAARTALILSLLMIAYMVIEFILYARAQSIGKLILGLQVVSSKDGKAQGFWRMVFREVIVKNASSFLLLGFLWILIDERNRGWHDKILDTYVVDLKESMQLTQNMQSANEEPASAPMNEERREAEDSRAE